METVATSVRITSDANRVLSELSAKLGQSKAQVVEQALTVLEDRLFWTEVQEAFACGESAELRVEREIWDGTVADGLSLEKW